MRTNLSIYSLYFKAKNGKNVDPNDELTCQLCFKHYNSVETKERHLATFHKQKMQLQKLAQMNNQENLVKTQKGMKNIGVIYQRRFLWPKEAFLREVPFFEMGWWLVAYYLNISNIGDISQKNFFSYFCNSCLHAWSI